MKFLLSWVVSAVSLAAAATLLGDHMNIGGPGQAPQDKIVPVAIVGLVFCLVNMFIAPIVKVLSLPFIVLTLGLFLLVLNALFLLLTAWITQHFHVDGSVPFTVDGFWWAMLGTIVISIVNAVLGTITRRA